MVSYVGCLQISVKDRWQSPSVVGPRSSFLGLRSTNFRSRSLGGSGTDNELALGGQLGGGQLGCGELLRLGQPAGAAQCRDQAQDQRGGHLPQRRIHHTTGGSHDVGAKRRVEFESALHATRKLANPLRYCPNSAGRKEPSPIWIGHVNAFRSREHVERLHQVT